MGRHIRQKKKQTEGKFYKSRKEIRKEQRRLKKAKRNEFFQRKKSKSGKYATGNTDHEEQTGSSVDVLVGKEQEKPIRRKYSERERNQKLQMDMKNQRIKQLKKANQQEDKVIKKLEKQLKLSKRKLKSVPKSFTADGLDYLLEICEQKNMEHATMLDLTLHDSGSQFEEDLALITGNSQRSNTVRQNNISVNNSNSDDDGDDDGDGGGDDDDDDDGDTLSDVHNFSLDKVADSDNEIEASEEGFGEMVSSDKSDNVGTDTEVEQNSQVHSESEIDRKGYKRILNGNKNEVDNDNHVLNDESGDIIENAVSKKRGLKRKRNKCEVCSVANNEGSAQIKRLRVHKRDTQECKLTDQRKCGGLEENCNRDNKNQDADFMETLRMKTRKQKHDLENIRCQSDEAIACGDGIDSEHEEDAGDIMEEKDEKEIEEYWEDIYGRTRDKRGRVIQANTEKYVPPHVRGSILNDDPKKQEQLKRLRRQMKGLLNRLAENNMNSIALQIEEMYMSHSRNSMNESLTDLLFESLVAEVITPERLIMEHAMLVAILHANVGTEVGAHILQVFVRKFQEYHQLEQEMENKQLDNILLILSHLYNFKIFNAVMMYDILEKLNEKFGEKEVELILLILRSVGFSLRKDDPLALKELILKLQQKAGEASQLKSSTRVKFMLEVLLAIKNNNMGRIPNYDPSHCEHLKKLMKGFLHKGNYITELKISLDDLLKADERGRWWVVGSAWTGPLPGKAGKQDPDNSMQLQQNNVYSQQLLNLARKHRMNTDVRRNIFCILMTAEDYLDAFEKLLHLGLKNQQEREIIHVIMNCYLQEKQFNPYYCHLSQKFCDFDRKYQITIQCALWDRFKELQNMPSFQVTNLAKFLVHLILQKGLPLSVLKVINFAEVDQLTVRFLRQVLLGVLLADSEEAFEQAFQRVALSSKLHLFQEGIRIFIHHFLLRNMSSLPQDDMETLQLRAKTADRILSAAESKVKF